jgi:hypothetical protein
MLVIIQEFTEKRTIGTQDDLVSFYLLVFITHQSDIGEVCVFSIILERIDNVLVEIIPL